MLLLKHFKNSLGLDLRSLAIYRFFLGIIVIADVIYRWSDLTNFYTDVGLIPRNLFLNEMTMPWSLSFHLANGSQGFAIFMFSLQVVIGLMLMFGYKTRWAIIAAFVMAVSVHNRNWLINNGGHDILRAILFISIFLPMNKRFSIDSALEKERVPHNQYFSTWALTFFLQVFLIYYVSYILKDSDIWRKDYTAFFYSSRLDIFSKPFGIWLRQFPELGKVITFVSIYLECLGPIFLIFSFLFGKNWWKIRTALVFLFIGFHFGIFLTMKIGLFTFICEMMWLIFLPGNFWDFFIKKGGLDSKKFTIYFDQECLFCLKMVRVIREFFLLHTVDILPAQSDDSIFKSMKKFNSWIVKNHQGDEYYRYDAFLQVLKYSYWGKLFHSFFSTKPLKLIGHSSYLFVSNNRNIFAKVSQFFPLTESKKEILFFRWVSESFGVFIFITIFAWNLTTIKKLNFNSPFFQNVTRWLHLYQEWNMFAPFPKVDNIWVEVPATLSDGSEIELLSGSRDIYSIKDQSFAEAITTDHWRKFYLNLSDKTDYARYFAGYLCRKWNVRKIQLVPGQDLMKFEIIVFSQLNLPNGDKGGIVRKLSWKHWCFDKDFQAENPKP